MNLPRKEAAQSLLDRAAICLEAGRVSWAKDLLHRALAVAPDLPEARLLEARLHLAAQNPRQALISLDMHSLQHPPSARNPEVLFLRAQAALAVEDDRLAQAALHELEQAFPEDVRTCRMVAAYHLSQGRWEQAHQAIAKWTRLAPSDRHVQRLRVELMGRSQPQQAAAAALAQHDSSHEQIMQLRRARLLRYSQRDREALELYEKLLVDFPEDDALLIEAAELADALGETSIALRWLGQALRLNPTERPVILRQFALMHMHLGQFPQAGRRWFALLRHQKEGSMAQAGLLLCALVVPDHDRLVERMQKSLDIHSSLLERRRWMAELWPHATLGLLYRAATSEVLAPSHASQGSSLLQSLLTHTAQTLTQHVQKYPQRADAHYHLAMSQTALQQVLQATHQVQRALAINPRYEAAHRLQHRLTRLTARAA